MADTQAHKCQKCKKFPMVVGGSGTVLCPRCHINATSIAHWNLFMKPVDIMELVEKLQRPISVLQSVATLTTDSGLRALAATTLKSIDMLDVSEHFTDPAEAEKVMKALNKALLK